MSPIIHVVIVNYRSVAYLTDCLTSLAQEPVTSILLFDNDSGDKERDALTALASGHPQVKLILGNHNLGFGAGVNHAISRLGAEDDDLVWILNPDTIVFAGAAMALANYMSSERSMVVSPLILSGLQQEPVIWFAGGSISTRRGASSHWGYGESAASAPKVPIDCTFITGAAPMMAVRTWKLLGGYREDLFLYWEDADLSLRARELGVELWLVPDGRVWHRVGASSPTESGLSALFYYYMQRNRLLVNSSHGSKFALLVGCGVGETTRLLAKAFMQERHHRWQKTCASLAGLRDGALGITGPRLERR